MTTSRRSFVFSVGSLLAVASLLPACSGSSGDSSGNGSGGGGSGGAKSANDECSDSSLTIVFSPMYSAYESSHTYQVPAIISGVASSKITWSASDSEAVSFANDSATGGVMITMHKAGTVTIFAHAGTLCGTSQLSITSATEEDWNAGNAAYTTEMANSDPRGFNTSCANCHEPSSTSPFKDISHTPEQTGGYSDTDLDQIIRKGVVPEGGYYDSSLVSKDMFTRLHQYSLTDDQMKGLIVYLRSLTPSAQLGTADFGGRGPDRDGGSPNGQGPDGGPRNADASRPRSDSGTP